MGECVRVCARWWGGSEAEWCGHGQRLMLQKGSCLFQPRTPRPLQRFLLQLQLSSA